MFETCDRHSPTRPAPTAGQASTAAPVPARRLWLLLAAALVLTNPGRTEAQECSAINSGDAVRLLEGQSYVDGALVDRGPGWARIDIGEDHQTVQLESSQPLEVHCLRNGQGLGHFLKRASGGALVGALTGALVRRLTKTEVPKETVCGPWWGCRQVASGPEPDPAMTWRSGALLGAGLGLVWAIVTRDSRHWVALDPTGPVDSATLVLEPGPGPDGSWTLAVRIPTSD